LKVIFKLYGDLLGPNFLCQTCSGRTAVLEVERLPYLVWMMRRYKLNNTIRNRSILIDDEKGYKKVMDERYIIHLFFLHIYILKRNYTVKKIFYIHRNIHIWHLYIWNRLYNFMVSKLWSWRAIKTCKYDIIVTNAPSIRLTFPS
jgi:hypothetical protein